MTIRGRAYDPLKRVMDVALGGAALAVTWPVIAAAAAAVRVSMGGPVFFRQQRPGRDGVPFELIKLRTMRDPRPGEHGPDADGQRLTPLGRVLRATSVDELPELINVLRGDMSLVGPRPLLMRYLERYSPEQSRRHDVKPGLTGWAAVNGRNAVDWEQKLELDVWYVDHRSLWLDLYILGLTVVRVLGRQGVSQEGHATMPEFQGSARRPDR
jgi:lipopolysaccharide/colanic/teichoic acid biosynthesis glycosyltransferase